MGCPNDPDVKFNVDESPKPPKPELAEPATPDVALLLNENDGPDVGTLLTPWA